MRTAHLHRVYLLHNIFDQSPSLHSPKHQQIKVAAAYEYLYDCIEIVAVEECNEESLEVVASYVFDKISAITRCYVT